MSTAETTAVPHSGALREVIRQNNARFEQAIERQDAAALAALYTEDAHVMPSNSDAIAGRANIQAFWESVLQAGIKSGRLETRELEVGGDFAVETGRYQLVIHPAGTAPLADEGKYLVVWHREADGSWKLHRDMFSSNLPPAPATVH